MRRVIVDYKKLTSNILDLLVEKYPDGYNDSDIVSFRNASNELIEAVEVRTHDTIYLVKVSVRLEERMDSFNEDEEDTSADNEVDIVDNADFEEELNIEEDID